MLGQQVGECKGNRWVNARAAGNRWVNDRATGG